MKVVLYSHHEALPASRKPEQPTVLFKSTDMANWKKSGSSALRDGRYTPAKNDLHWPVLMGLDMIDKPISGRRLLGHMSIEFEPATRTFQIPERVWVQVTTLPSEDTREGIPIVLKGGRVVVEHLWAGDYRTHSPYELIGRNLSDYNRPMPVEKTPTFWAAFFFERLYGAKPLTINARTRAGLRWDPAARQSLLAS